MIQCEASYYSGSDPANFQPCH